MHDKQAVGGIRRRQDVPRQHLVARHARHFAVAVQSQRDLVHLALHHLPVEQRGLAHQSGADADLRFHFGGVKQFSLAFRLRLLPRKIHRTVHRQKAREIGAVAFGPRGVGELKLRVRRQSLQHDGLQNARRDAKIHRAPTFVLADGGVEFDLDWKNAATVEGRNEPVLFRTDCPIRMRADFRERDRAGQQFERTARRIFHAHISGERERCDVATQIANELEILQRDAAGGTFRDCVVVMVLHEVARNTSAQKNEAKIFVFIIQSVF